MATAGSLIIDLENKTLNPEERELLQHPLVTGVILFTRNYDSREQLNALCHDIRKASKKSVLIMVDQEGGRVQRFINEFTRLPAMGKLGELYDHDAKKALQLTTNCAWLMAYELLSIGVDLSLAPVLDLNKNKNTVIGNRAFHSQTDSLIILAQAFIQGMQEAGMAICGKHFPGHGHVTADSHLAMPYDERTLAEIEQDDIVPFAHFIQTGISALMAAHIIFPQVDDKAVGFSRIWLQDILRKRLGFTGVIISDDLNMEGANISANYADRMELAREAGCDFILLCNNRKGVIQVLDEVAIDKHVLPAEKLTVLQGKFPANHSLLTDHPRWRETNHFLQTFI